MNNNNTKTTNKSFVESFKSIEQNLIARYCIQRELDFINEFVKYVDNTRNLDLAHCVVREITSTKDVILKLINEYEADNKEKID